MSAHHAIRRTGQAGLLMLVACGGQLALARGAFAAAPTVSTGGTSAVHGSAPVSATLEGVVNPEGEEVTSCQFEYGTSEAYGYTATCVPSPGSGSGPVTVSAHIAGEPLRPGNLVVHYRLVAGNATSGVVAGEDNTFETEPWAAPLAGGLGASSVTQFGATLNGTLQTDEAIVNYHFEYGTTTAYGQVAPIPDDDTPITAETVSVSQPVGDLLAGTTYHYRLLASSPGGTAIAGPDETFTTLPIPAPTVGTGGTSSVGVGSATLSGTVDPQGWDTSYLFEYGPSTTYGQSWPTVPVELGALEGSQPVVVNISNLLPGTTYHYRLVATNGGGTSYGQDMTFTTGEYPAQVIQEPASLGTLVVPSGNIAKPTAKKTKKTKKSKKGKQSKKKKGKRHKQKTGKK
jgi:hypothetical protein